MATKCSGNKNHLEVNHRLDSSTARAYTQPALLHQINPRSTDSLGDNKNMDNFSFGYGSSSYITTNPVDNQHPQSIYPPSVSR